MPGRLLFAHDEPTNGFTRVRVGTCEGCHGDVTNEDSKRTLDDVVVQRSQLLRSLLSTEGETCVPVLPCHLKLWTKYDQSSVVDMSSLLSILEVRGALQKNVQHM